VSYLTYPFPRSVPLKADGICLCGRWLVNQQALHSCEEQAAFHGTKYFISHIKPFYPGIQTIAAFSSVLTKKNKSLNFCISLPAVLVPRPGSTLHDVHWKIIEPVMNCLITAISAIAAILGEGSKLLHLVKCFFCELLLLLWAGA